MFMGDVFIKEKDVKFSKNVKKPRYGHVQCGGRVSVIWGKRDRRHLRLHARLEHNDDDQDYDDHEDHHRDDDHDYHHEYDPDHPD